MPAPNAPPPVRLLYVLSKGRSGSTLTGFLLGAHPEVTSTGEIELYTWHHTRNVEKRTCACGQPLQACPFWTGVRARLAETFGDGVPDVDAPGDAAFARANAALFGAIAAEGGTAVVLDKSKKLGRALRLLRAPGFDVTVLHLVRDARAVADSFRRRGERRGMTGLLKYNFYKNAFRWTWLNAAMALRLGRHPRYVRVRYEDVVADPARALAPVLERAGLAPAPLPRRLDLARYHEVGGNEIRTSGALEVRPDARYLANVGAFEWLAATALAWPLLLAFGYPLGRRYPAVAAAPAAPPVAA
jgi:hypothetical protein